ncbi:hypothetical protein C471_05521 [Halorubrum saccharovorum DSM 1137]|uniref:DUF7993 domain-containing protein n=1 Tax=Halorubrum saccharovorum DSM 1137 TaxID=1227484 RepID=M0E3S4_9EURY|nr:hypothetical protein [Halorubrum saccharovorum]ELZ41693.1 hypothetical protein C471_05521 [Halorubrum saccharovorum DSM 1137]
MVADRLTDGVRIGQLLASEVSGNEGRLRDLALADADPDVEPTADGALAYRVVRGGEGGAGDGDEADRDLVAEAYVQPDRLRIEFVAGAGGEAAARDADDAPGLPAVAADAAEREGLRVRPKAVRPPRTLVFVEDGAQVKRALPVFEAVVDATGNRE